MKVLVRMSGATVLAVLAFGVLLPSAALSALPEAGKCTEVEPGKGKFINNSCTNPATERRPGNFEFKALEASEVIEPGGASGEVKLTTSGHPTIKCMSSSFLGHFTGAKTELLKVVLRECKNPIAQTCQTNPSEAGVIESVPLEGELGYIKYEDLEGKFHVSVGMDLKPAAPIKEIAAYTCGTSAETATIEGSVIAKYKEIDKPTRASDLIFTSMGAKQIPEAFQEGSTDTLTTTYVGTGGPTSAATSVKAKMMGGISSPVTTPEIVVKAYER